MLYKQSEFPKLMQTAGKITILTALTGMMVFVVAFLFDAGTQQLREVSAQTATTTLTVLNTPPSFTLNAYEVTESSTSSPTNSGDTIQWRAIGSDTNAAPYFLLICSTNASPTANAAPNLGALGTVPPSCGGGATRWGVSAGTPSGTAATVSTTTTEVAPFAEVNNWYGWVCDDDPTNPRCNSVPVQGYSATNSSPFNVNKRPVLTDFYNNGPVDPGGTLTFFSTSTDPDTVGGEDTIKLVVCQTNSYNTTTNTCSSGFLASTTVGVTADATAVYTLASIVRDDVYGAWGFIVDQHGHEASANPINENFTVNNVAPTTLGADIDLGGTDGLGFDIELTVEADETPGNLLSFTLRDANSCVNTSGTPGSEFATPGYRAAVYKTSIGTTTCNSTAGSYNPNNCYPSQALSSTWNLSCTASTTSCTGPGDDTMIYNCSFPLWFVADPTDGGSPFAADTWSAAVAGVDDDGAFGPLVAGSSPVELISFTAIDLITAQIPYGALEPGNNSGTLNATTTIRSTGNTGLDQSVQGESMCPTFAIGNECVTSATSTVPENQQKFSSTSLSYGSGLATLLSSTTLSEVELDINKSTSTSTPTSGITYWGIAVPSSITLAGAYTGLNTFYGVTAEPADW